MKAHKLPSGNWNVQVMRNKVSHSFTASTKGEAIKMASAFIAQSEYSEREGITVKEALEQYIETKQNVLSPSTLSVYRKIKDNHLELLAGIPINRLTSVDIQQAINAETVKKTPHGKQVSAKTVRNVYGLLSAALRMFRPEFQPNVTLPKSVRTFRDMPEPEEVIKAIKGTDIELPCFLALWLSLSASEIRGIKVSSIKDGYLTIDESVLRMDGVDIHKPQAKTFTRNRRIKIPAYIMKLIEKTEAWQKGDGYIEKRTGQALYDRLQEVMKDTGIKIRFHDLRHLWASIGAKLQVSEKTLQEMGGWSNPHVMQNVYQHSFESDRQKTEKAFDDFFAKFI